MRTRNPILSPERYFPDGEGHVVNGELFIYPSCDQFPGEYCSDELYVVHSRDLSDWQIDGPVFTAGMMEWEPLIAYPPGLMEAAGYDDLPKYLKDSLSDCTRRMLPFEVYRWWNARRARSKKRVGMSRRLLYAPDALTVHGRSCLFFCTSDGCEGVAFSDTPAGPFTDPVRITLDRSGKPISGIDPAVFQDDDGKVYLYWGQISSFGAELTDDLTRVKEDTLVTGLLTEREHGFHEGSSIRKINGTYYAVFADMHRGKPTALGYATSISPLGPFVYQGIIVDNDGCDPETWNNHGSIVCVNGQWYVIYHRSTGNSRYLRRMCAEPIQISGNGQIPEVPVSSIGMGEPYRIGEVLPAYEACLVSGSAYLEGDRLKVKKGQGKVVYRYVDLRSLNVSRLSYTGTGSPEIRWSVDAKGELRIRIEAEQDLEIVSFRLEV